jgi:hypothetical protein
MIFNSDRKQVTEMFSGNFGRGMPKFSLTVYVRCLLLCQLQADTGAPTKRA